MDSKWVVLGATAIASAGAGVVAGWQLCKKKMTGDYERQLEDDRAAIKWSYEQLLKNQKPDVVPERRSETVRTEPMEAREDEPSMELLERVRAGLKNWDTGEQHKLRNGAAEAMVAYSAGAVTADTVVEVLERYPKPSLLTLGDDPFQPEEKHLFDNTPEEVSVDDIRAMRGSGKKPYVLHKDEFLAAEPGYPQITIVFYSGDGVLADESDTPIENVDAVIGKDNLERFGVGSDDPRIVFVRNDRLGADYEVLYHETKYAEVVLGEAPDTFEKIPKRNLKKNADN
jgi:hypothetical protein